VVRMLESKLSIEFQRSRRSARFLELLKALGLVNTIKRWEVVIHCNKMFRSYLKDRGLSEGTARDYMNCLRRLDGKAMNYDLMSRKYRAAVDG